MITKWQVTYDDTVEDKVREQLASGDLTADDMVTIARWTRQIETKGLETVQTREWNDHELYGIWKGHRSASFSRLGRIIYRVQDGRLIVSVVRVTAIHDYGR